MKEIFSEEEIKLIKKYETQEGSFYTFYPHAGIWSQTVEVETYKQALKTLSIENPDAPIAIYFHFPYCPKQCFFCQCYTVISNNYSKTEKVVGYILREMDLLLDYFKEISFKPNIREVHFGGGSPSHLREPEVTKVVEKLSNFVAIDTLDEFSIEIDPRFEMTQERIKFYADVGINRISIGIQDFDPKTQKALNRIHSAEDIERLFPPEIKSLFKSVNVDLIYGLPFQTRETFRETMETIKRIAPDRIALCVLGYRPDIFKFQSVIKEEDLPNVFEKTKINDNATSLLLDEGYERIGIDHFSKPTDDLAIARRKKIMRRNAMGYTSGRYTEMIGFGPSAMGMINECYFQNIYDLEKYYSLIDSNTLSVFRGHEPNKDDLLRRHIINSIILEFEVDIKEVEGKFKIDFKDYFNWELDSLAEGPVKDGLLVINDNRITLTSVGRRFQRQICKHFDRSSTYKHSREFASASQ